MVNRFTDHPLIVKHGQKLKFGLVGIANTALDFILLFLFVGLGLNSIVANYFSTGLSFIFSFFVNRSFTFKHTEGNVKKQFVVFLVVTIIGIWIIQPILIASISWALTPLIANNALVLFIAKLVATVGSLIWNYLFYSRIVFKKSGTES